MKFWSRRNKIEFFHIEPSIIDSFPIIESKDLKLDWVKRVREDFQKEQESATHLVRCPGIFDLFKYGYIVSLHKDVSIVQESKDKFGWQFVQRNQFHTHNFNELFQLQGVNQQISDMLPKPSWAANFMIKIDTGWHIVAPKGIKFIMLPIAYPDTFDFTSAIGILDPSINSQIFWNIVDKKETILPAGTPLGHLIPLTEKKYKMVQRVMDQHDLKWVEKFYSLLNTSFRPSTIRNKMVNMYNNHWKR